MPESSVDLMRKAVRALVSAAWRGLAGLQRIPRRAENLGRAVIAGAGALRHRARVEKLQREAQRRRAGTSPAVVLAIGDWTFPVLSHRFLYEELAALQRAGLDVRLVWSRRRRDPDLHPRFAALAGRGILLSATASTGSADLAWYRATRGTRLEETLHELADATGVGVAELLCRREVLRALSFARLAEAARADYLHGYFFYEGGLAAHIASRLLGIPRGVTCYADHLLADWDLKAVRLQLDASSLVVATSRRIAAEIAGLCPAARAHTLVKPNSLSTSVFPPRTAPPRRPAEPLRLVTVSRIDPKKGLEFLIEAMASLSRSGIQTSLTVVGGVDTDSPSGSRYLAELTERVERVAARGEVEFLGWRSEGGVGEELRRAHVFVAPAVETAAGDKDGIPTSLLEAMSSGLAVVASDAGSIREAVTHEVDGLLVPQRDVGALSGALARLAGDPQLAERLGRAAAAKARRRFDTAVCDATFAASVRTIVAAQRTVAER